MWRDLRLASFCNTCSVNELIGFAAAIIGALAFLPQVLKTWGTRSSADLSWAMIVALLTAALLWVAYGVRIGSPPIVEHLLNAVQLLLQMVEGLIVAKTFNLARRFVRHREVCRGSVARPVEHRDGRPDHGVRIAGWHVARGTRRPRVVLDEVEQKTGRRQSRTEQRFVGHALCLWARSAVKSAAEAADDRSALTRSARARHRAAGSYQFVHGVSVLPVS